MAQLEIQFSGCDNVPEGKDDVSDQDKAEVLERRWYKALTICWIKTARDWRYSFYQKYKT